MKKGFSIVMAAVLSGAAIGGLGYFSKGFTDWSAKDWVDLPVQTEPDTPPDADPTDSETDVPKMTLRMNSRSFESSGEATVTASITPSDATDTRLSWSLSWKNASSSWASGKSVTDYMTLTPNGSSATLKLRSAFGESIKLTAVSVEDPSITADCSVDYVSRLSLPHGGAYMDISRVFGNGNTGTDVPIGSTFTMRVDTDCYGIGTTRGTFSFSRMTFSLNESLKTSIKNAVSGYPGSWTFSTTGFFVPSNGVATNAKISSVAEFFQFFGDSTPYRTKLINAFVTAVKDNALKYYLNCDGTFTYSYDGVTIQTGAVRGIFYPEPATLTISVEDVTLDDSAVVF